MVIGQDVDSWGAEECTIPVKEVAILEFLIVGTMVKAELLVTDQLSSEAILGQGFLE